MLCDEVWMEPQGVMQGCSKKSFNVSSAWDGVAQEAVSHFLVSFGGDLVDDVLGEITLSAGWRTTNPQHLRVVIVV